MTFLQNLPAQKTFSSGSSEAGTHKHQHDHKDGNIKMIKSVDANAPDYWENVKKNATRRRGLEIVKRRFEKMHVSLVYEQYVSHCLEFVQQAAKEVGLTDSEQYQQFRQECAELMKLPEIASEDEDAIFSYAAQLVSEAQCELYGEYYVPPVSGGYQLDDTRLYVECDHCGKDAIFRHWEENEGGSINAYTTIHCEHCGASE